MFKEFKTFVMRGNVLDLAVGIMIGAAFGKIVNSLVNDVLMPPIGLLLGKMDFSSLFINLSTASYPSVAAARAAGAPTIAYGLFINALIDFVILAFVIFLIVRAANKITRPQPATTTKDCPYCLSPIPIKATRCAHCTAELKMA